MESARGRALEWKILNVEVLARMALTQDPVVTRLMRASKAHVAMPASALGALLACLVAPTESLDLPFCVRPLLLGHEGAVLVGKPLPPPRVSARDKLSIFFRQALRVAMARESPGGEGGEEEADASEGVEEKRDKASQKMFS